MGDTAVALLIRAAQRDDLPAIEALLASLDLTAAGVGEHLHQFLVAEVTGGVVASAGLEVYGAAALLRSVAVDTSHRGRGLARSLITRLLDQARRSGVRDVYLLTTTAEGYFGRLGFGAIPREAVDPSVQHSAEFGDRLCATARAMRLRLADGRPQGGSPDDSTR